MKLAYEAKGSQHAEFVQSVKDLDVNQATSLADTTKQVRELIKTNIGRNSELVKKTADKMHSQFKKQHKLLAEVMKETDKAYDRFVRKFNNNEDSFRSGDKIDFEQDLWYVQYQYLRKAKEGIDCINALKETLFLTWDHGKDKELTRLQAIKALFDGIVSNNSAIFGQNIVQQEIVAKINGIDQTTVAN